jgi:hypothetical protein
MIPGSHPHNSYFDTNESSPVNIAGTTVASGATAHTYGSWVQIHAGFTKATNLVEVNITNVGAAAQNYNGWIDIGVGPDSSNVTPIIEKLAAPHGFIGSAGGSYWMPLRILKGVKVWARSQHTIANRSIGVQISAQGGNQNPDTMPYAERIIPLGYTSASTTGTAISSGNIGASGAEGTWSEIVASTSEDYSGIMISPLFFTGDTTLGATMYYSYDLAIGAAGNEISIGENITMSSIISSNESGIHFSYPALLGIPVGSRLSVRVSCHTTLDTPSYSIILYGLKH